MRKIDLYLLLKNRRLSRQTRSARTDRSLGWVVRSVVAVVSILVIGLLAIAGYSFTRFARDLPSIEILPVLLDKENGELLQPTRMLDRSGEVTLFTYQDENIERKFLSIDPLQEEHISPQLIRSVTATFDPTFWTNPGYSLKQWNSLEPQTIAERLVSELILWDESPSQTRTIRMRMLAGQVVAQYGRTSVIEWYLNSAWFGRYAYGAESAAQLYLGKSARDLTLAESALLTSLLQSPALNPLDAPQTALTMQQDLLKEMLTNGAINQEEYDLAMNEEIKLRTPEESPATVAAGFVKQVEKQLGSVLGSQRLQRGGLIVRTTLDADLQNQLICTTATQLIRVQYSNVSGVAPENLNCQSALLLPTQSFSGFSGEGLSAAGLVMDPQSGEVLAYLEPYTLSGERLIDSGYQPGSLLTPIAAFIAFSRGYSPASLVWDIPPTATSIISGALPVNTTYHGAVNIRGALANDYLNPIASLVAEIGAENVWRSGTIIGLKSLSNAQNDPSPFFGGSETSLLQLGTAYSTFANSGVRSGRLDADTNEVVPETVLKVTTPTDRILYEKAATEHVVILDDALAYLVNNVLSDESARWPSLGYPNVLEVGSPVAAKTGSADNHSQVWTVGYTPQRLVLIWMGTRDGADTQAQLDERMAAGIWHALYKYATKDIQFTGWSMPAGVTEMQVCSPSGMLPTEDCPNVVSDVFLYGNEPTLPDTLYNAVKVNRETGQLATVFTPADLVEEKVFINVPIKAREWATGADLALAPQGYDSIQLTQIDPAVNISEPALFSTISGKIKIRGTASGDNFSSYQVQIGEGINPETWQQVNASSTRQVHNGSLAEWDTSDLNGLYAIRLSVIDENHLIKTAITQVTVDNTPPSTSISYPLADETVEPVRYGVTLNAIVEDLVGIDRVEWWVDGKLVLTQTSPPFLYQLQSVSGKHKAYIKAWDTAGNQSQSDEIPFRIQP